MMMMTKTSKRCEIVQDELPFCDDSFIFLMTSCICIFNNFRHMQHAKYRDRFASKTKYRNRLAVTPLKSPPGKKAKMTTPSKSNNTGEKCYFLLLACLLCRSVPCNQIFTSL
jgi:hypothetical protein